MEDSNDVKKETKPVDESPSRSKDLSKTLPEEAFNNFLQGKRHMLVQDYAFAVQSLSTACELYAQHFGELALECGEVHFLYGKALFRLSQQQAGVLGGALNEETNEEDDEEEEPEKSSEEENKENEESEKNDSDTENGEGNQEENQDGEGEGATEEKEPSESTDSPQHVGEENPKESNEKENEEPASAENEASNSNDDQQEPEEDDLELAWNSLETAKSIFLRQGEDNVEAQLKVAEILQLLAEISMESDNNIAAISDLKACLEIKKRHLSPDDRLLAETYYQMGLAQMLEKMYIDALDNFRTTVKILELKIENLKSTPVSNEPGSFERADIEKEIEDLESVLSDIREKIEDTRELIEDAKKAVEERLAIKRNESEKVGFPEADKSTSKPVSNITHLLKRKKPDQEEDRESKRTKLSPSALNGDATVTE